MFMCVDDTSATSALRSVNLRRVLDAKMAVSSICNL
jgi:hypothetical protein